MRGCECRGTYRPGSLVDAVSLVWSIAVPGALPVAGSLARHRWVTAPRWPCHRVAPVRCEAGPRGQSGAGHAASTLRAPAMLGLAPRVLPPRIGRRGLACRVDPRREQLLHRGYAPSPTVQRDVRRLRQLRRRAAIWRRQHEAAGPLGSRRPLGARTQMPFCCNAAAGEQHDIAAAAGGRRSVPAAHHWPGGVAEIMRTRTTGPPRRPWRLVRQSEIVIWSSAGEAGSLVEPAGAGLVAPSPDVPSQVVSEAVPVAGE
jgi:hypothetical protein